MVTNGEITLDVEDNRSPSDWPALTDVAIESLDHSVHFPLIPQTGVWPNGERAVESTTPTPPSPEVVRVLNIVVPESRILASRERCPYLIHMEVADSGWEGDDARLYSTPGIGTTIEETLNLRTSESSGEGTLYNIPPELSTAPSAGVVSSTTSFSYIEETLEARDPSRFEDQRVPRGGGQLESTIYGDPDSGYAVAPDYREREYQRLHEEMNSSPPPPREWPEQEKATYVLLPLYVVDLSPH